MQSYTDARTGITHIYAKQLLNGFEVSDGDINLNIDRNGNVISWGSSFHKGGPEAVTSESTRSCAILNEQLEAHRAELGETGPWALIKSAAQVVYPIFGGHKSVNSDERIQKNMEHISNHIDALCDQDPAEVRSPIDALVALIPRIAHESSSFAGISRDDFTSHPEHSFAPKPAPAEPPTQHISGPGLAKAGIKSHVPARFMYTQVSDGAPRWVWKLEVELESNWYEAYIDVANGELIRIVDWAKEYSWASPSEEFKDHKQKPLPSPPKDKLKPYTYQIFPWGELAHARLTHN